MITVKDIYAATNDGRDIITDLCPAAQVAVENPKKAFRLRPDERTPSAYLYPPRPGRDHWAVVDYGRESHALSPIDLYMQVEGIARHDFTLAVRRLAEQYGVREQLSASVNKPRHEVRPARADEQEGQYVYNVREGFTPRELAVWGPRTEAAHLAELGWTALECVGRVHQGQVHLRHSTEDYPIFAERCEYTTGAGDTATFLKLYEPLNPDKRFRFQYIGTPPRGYIFGLTALRRKFRQQGEKRLPAVAIVSGGSDAVCCLAMGVQPVWMQSETAELTEADLRTLQELATTLYAIPDLDYTGRLMGTRLALRHIDVHTLWLPREVMAPVPDQRGRQRKDLKDYLQLRPSQRDFQRLLRAAMPARFWDWAEKPDGQNTPRLSLTRLCYLLSLLGFYTLRDPHARGGQRLVRVEGCRVSSVMLTDVCMVLTQWMQEHDLPEAIIDKTLRSKDLTMHLMANLPPVVLNMQTATEHSQLFFFENCAVEVTPEAIRPVQYRDLAAQGVHVWAEHILPHTYAKAQAAFTWQFDEDGACHLHLEGEPCDCLRFLRNASRLHWRKELEEGLPLTAEEQREEELSLQNKLFALGYLLHQHKQESQAWAVLLLDGKVGEQEECNGRSGKSLYGRVAGHFAPMLCIDGKRVGLTESQFFLAGLKDDTRIIFIDECRRQFDFPFLLGKITEGLTVEKKGVDPYTLPFDVAPKWMLGTNHVLRDMDSSTQARLLPVVFSDYYHQRTTQSSEYREDRSVRDDLGHDLMTSDYQGWAADIPFVLLCEQFYLSVMARGDGRRILPPMDSIERRRQRANLGKSFEQWAQDYFQPGGPNLDTKLNLTNVYTDFCSETGANLKVSRQQFGKKLKAFCDFAGYTYNPGDITGQGRDGERWREEEQGKKVTYIYLRSTNEGTPANRPAVQSEIPF